MSFMQDSYSFDPYTEQPLDELPRITESLRRKPVEPPSAAELKRDIDAIGEGPATVTNVEITDDGVTSTSETVWVSNAALREQFLRGDHR